MAYLSAEKILKPGVGDCQVLAGQVALHAGSC